MTREKAKAHLEELIDAVNDGPARDESETAWLDRKRWLWYTALYAMTQPPVLDRMVELQTVLNAVIEQCAAICDRFAERDMHPSECAAAIRALKVQP